MTVDHDENASRSTDGQPCAAHPTLEMIQGRQSSVGGLDVVRLLPRRARRLVGAWCFADLFGPVETGGPTMQVGPHPHIGLHTVTWLLDGEVRHTDSLGFDQLIRPGQLNLMTAGDGIAHAETATDPAAPLHGIQLWVAQPESTRHGPAAFEHHDSLPSDVLDGVEVTVLLGHVASLRSPATTDTPIVGAQLTVPSGPGSGAIPLDPDFEHALIPLSGRLDIEGTNVSPGALAYLGRGRSSIQLAADGATRALLLGGAPFEGEVAMWWNFVARTDDEIDRARSDWAAASARFGSVRSDLPPIPAPER